MNALRDRIDLQSRLETLQLATGLAKQVCEIALKSTPSRLDGGYFVAGGSLSSGHYGGPKKRLYSNNPHCPFERVVELDGRFVLPHGLDPWEDNTIDQFAKAMEEAGLEVCGPRPKDFTDKAWGKPRDSTIYGYIQIGEEPTLGMEFEWAIVEAGWVEIATAWPHIHTPDEVAWQRDVKLFLQRRETAPEIVRGFKSRLCKEADYRLLQCYASGSNHVVPLGPQPAEISEVVKQWPVGMNRPQRPLSPELTGLLPRSLRKQPKRPLWLRNVERVMFS